MHFLLNLKPFLIWALPLWSSTLFSDGAGHSDPVAPILLGIIVLFTGAKFGGFFARILKQPVVLGELILGVILGNLTMLGFFEFDYIASHEVFNTFAAIGVILLLFEVGLESSLHEMMKVGFVATLVAIIGVIAPFFLGFGVSYLF